jgi:hypothetical protein
MRRTNILKKNLLTKILLLSTAATLVISTPAFVFADSTSATAPQPSDGGDGDDNDGITLYSDDIAWVMKTVNGKRYKALYNFTTGKYLTDWIPVD